MLFAKGYALFSGRVALPALRWMVVVVLVKMIIAFLYGYGSRASLLLCCLLLVWLSSCLQSPPEGPYVQYVQYAVHGPNEKYRNYASDALESWALGLALNQTGKQRNYKEGHLYNPRNWITVVSGSAKEACLNTFGLFGRNPRERGGGVGQDLCKDIAEKPGKTSIIGLCITRYNDIYGWIGDTTLVVKEEYLLGSGTTEAQAKAVFAHEIGHALGLQHWGNEKRGGDSALEPGEPTQHVTHIMYPKTAYQESSDDDPIFTSTSPSDAERAAVAAVYTNVEGEGSNNPVGDSIQSGNSEECSDQNGEKSSSDYSDYEDNVPCYYNQVERVKGGKKYQKERLYHPGFPKFTISASIGNGYSLGGMSEPGPPVNEDDLMVKIQLFRKDGSEEVLHGPFRAKR